MKQMIIDMRYHIVSLVAVFLALGLGILLGFALLGNGTIVQEQRAMIERLEADFAGLRQDQAQLESTLKEQKAVIDFDNQFGREILPLLVKDMLLGRRVAVIRTGDALTDKSYKDIANALKLAGAKVVSLTTFLRGVDFADPVQKQQTLEALGLPSDYRKDLSEELFGAAAREIATGQSGTTLGYLQDSAVVQASGDFSKPVDAVIIIGGANDPLRSTCRTIDLPMIAALRRMGVAVVAAEPVKVEVSYMRDYRQRGVTTVDNIDGIPGHVALVYSLAWGKQGNYGVKEGARSLLPEF